MSLATGKRILICVPNVARRPNNTHRMFTLALLYLQKACQRAGWECQLLDAYFDNLTHDETVTRILAMGTFDVVGFTLNDDAMFLEADAICTRLTDSPVVIAGGVYATRMAQQILDRSSHIDHIFKGESDASLEQFLRQWGQPDNLLPGMLSRASAVSASGAHGMVRMISGGPKQLNMQTLDDFGDWRYADLPVPVGSDEYTLVTSRGCTARCNYCVIGPHWSRYGLWRGHSAEWILEKMKELRDLGAEHVNIVDDQFVGSEQSIARAYRLADLLDQHAIRLPFVIMTRADTVNRHPGLFLRLQEVGLRMVFIGLESGCDDILDKLRKDTTADAGRSAVAHLAALDIEVSGGTIIFHPWTSVASLRMDIAYFSELLEQHTLFNFYGLNELDLLNGTPVSKIWQGDKEKWHADWCCAEPAADEIYQGWLKAQRIFLFPLLARLGPTRSRALRRHSCRWMLETLTCLIDAQQSGNMGAAYLQLSLSIQMLALKAGLVPTSVGMAPDLLRSPTDAATGERCFE
jgi:radical SAM superfamily enzyme YgiQ (UPF0313 family)